MNLYYLKRKIHYRLNAKNRHHIHSPFVFDFIEKVLRAKKRSEGLIDSVQQYLRGEKVVTADIHDFYSGKNNYAAHDEVCIVLTNIHASAEGYAAWCELITKDWVPLSIELDNIGLLCLKRQFLIKQHFIVK